MNNLNEKDVTEVIGTDTGFGQGAIFSGEGLRVEGLDGNSSDVENRTDLEKGMSEKKISNREARKITELINQATDEEAVALAVDVAKTSGGVNEVVEEIGVVQSNETVKAMVAAENGYQGSELEPGAVLVGAESRILIDERKQADREDFENELDAAPERMRLRHDRLTDEGVEQVRKMIRENADFPGRISSGWFKGMTNFLATNYNRKIGERN